MKKLLALLLSMIMAVSLAVPAFADDTPDISPYPGEDWDFNWTAEDEWAYICEEYPERTAAFMKEAEEWYAAHTDQYPWYDADTFAEFVQNVGGEEAAYLSLFYDWNWVYEQETARREFITAHGGVPGQIGVMINGEYIKFPDAVPEITGGRTMVPVRAIIETLGGKVSTLGSDVRCTLDGVTVIFTLGSKEAVIELETDDEEGCEQTAGVIDMDCAPYVKGGRTYVPVRFIAETLGYDVGWESAYQTAVLLDWETLTAEIDENFTILNKALANTARAMEEGKNYRYEQKGNVTFTAFDTLNGNTTYQAGFTGKELLSSEASNGVYTITMSDTVMDVLMEMILGANWAEAGEDAQSLRTFLEGFRDIEVIVTREGLYWVHAPALDELAGEDDVWCVLPVDPDAAAAAFTGTEAATVGQILPARVNSSFVMFWSDVMDAAGELAAVVGDDCFTTSGGTSTLTIDLDTLDPDGEMGLKDAYQEMEVTLKIDDKGGADLSCKLQTVKGRPGMRLTVDCALSSGRASLTLECHVSNMGELELTLSSQRQTTSEEPVSEPPEGAVVVDAPELLQEGYSNGQ